MALTAGGIVVATDGDHIETPSNILKSYREVITITDANVKLLPTTPYQLVAAPGANKILILQEASIYTDFTAAYGNINADSRMWVKYASGNVASGFIVNETAVYTQLTTLLTQNGAFTADDSLFWHLQKPFRYDLNDSWDAMNTNNIQAGLNVNKALQLTMDNNGSGVLNSGNSGNVFKVAIKWDVWDLS